MKYETIEVTDKRTKKKPAAGPSAGPSKNKKESKPNLVNKAMHKDYFNAKEHAFQFIHSLERPQLQNLYDCSTLQDFFTPHEMRALISRLLTEQENKENPTKKKATAKISHKKPRAEGDTTNP